MPLKRHYSMLGCGLAFVLATQVLVQADEPAASSGEPATGPLPTTSGAPTTPADSSDNSSNPQAPVNLEPNAASQNPINSQGPEVPLLPQQGVNPNSPFSTSSTNPQSPLITNPTLFVTGQNNLTQISANAGLTQAFTSTPNGEGFYSEPGVDYTHGPIERIRIGPFDLKTALTLDVISDDNLRTGQEGQGKIGDTSYGVTPAILLQYGTHEGEKGYASLVYAPTLIRFFHHSDQNSDDQNVALNAQYPFQRLTLDLEESYTQTTGVNQDSNTRTTQTSSATSVGGSYEVDDKISVASHFNEDVTTFGGVGSQNSDAAGGGAAGQGDTTSSINNSLSYRLSEKISLGPSVNVGVDKPQDEAQQTFEQALVGATYVPTEKISFFAQGGAEFRQYDHGGGDKTNPIFSLGVGYTPFDSTSLSLSASQSVHSDTADQNQSGPEDTVVDTGVQVSATQRIAQRFFVNFAFSYDHNETQFGSTGATGPTTAADTLSSSEDTLTYRPSVSFAPSLWTTVSVYYQYLSNQSNLSADSYNDNQVGLSVTAQF
jgi:hypothetical protein